MPTQQQRPGTNGSQNGSDIEWPRNPNELQGMLLSGARGNPLFDQVNLGQGNYSDDDFWQQIRAYRRGLYVYIAFGSTLEKRAIHETKVKLAREGYTHYNEEGNQVEQWQPLDADDVAEDESSWEAELRRGEEIWNSLGDNREVMTTKQAAAILKKTNADTDWLPVPWQMVVGRHEASRSREAELLRDLLTNPKKSIKSPEALMKALSGGKS